MQSQAYNQALKAALTTVINDLRSFQALTSKGVSLRKSNVALLELVEKMQSDIQEVEASTRKNMWKVWQELLTLSPARSWDVFNQRIEEVLGNWDQLLVVTDQCLASVAAAADAVASTSTPDPTPTPHAQRVEALEAMAKAEGIDFRDEPAMLASIAQCVAPAKLEATYKAEVMRRDMRKRLKVETFKLVHARDTGDQRWLNEWVLKHTDTYLTYKATPVPGGLRSEVVDVLDAPGLCLMAGRDLVERVSKDRGHGLVLARRHQAIAEEIKSNHETLATLGAC